MQDDSSTLISPVLVFDPSPACLSLRFRKISIIEQLRSSSLLLFLCGRIYNKNRNRKAPKPELRLQCLLCFHHSSSGLAGSGATRLNNLDFFTAKSTGQEGRLRSIVPALLQHPGRLRFSCLLYPFQYRPHLDFLLAAIGNLSDTSRCRSDPPFPPFERFNDRHFSLLDPSSYSSNLI